VLVAFGVVSRLCKYAVNKLREKGLRVGLYRPITLSPFPSDGLATLAAKGVKKFFVVELNIGQMVYDVRLAVESKDKVELVHKVGGLLPTSADIIRTVEAVSR
jgi:2-oxoglutarate/2-oxoacid ferredoxin oxidoreductase subunit alpha